MNYKKNVNIIGVGGHARSVASLLIYQGFNILNYFDDNGSNNELLLGKIKYGGGFNAAPYNIPAILAIGENGLRKKLFEEYANIYQDFISHDLAFIEPTAKIGQATLVFAGAKVSVEAEIGNNCIINTNAIIEHESTIGNHSHVSIGAIVAGRVNVGENCFLGAGAIVKDKTTIVSNVIIGAGAVVVRDILEPGTYVGIPAQKM